MHFGEMIAYYIIKLIYVNSFQIVWYDNNYCYKCVIIVSHKNVQFLGILNFLDKWFDRLMTHP